jgi:transposase
MVLMVGVDVHKDTHTAVLVDELGRRQAARTVKATDAGHLQLLAWAVEQASGVEVCWAVEDCRHVSTRLERALLAADQRVLRVPPKLMAGARSSARTRGKSDPIDALAIARAALREPELPVAEHDQTSLELKLLVDHREDLVGERTKMICRLRWHLHDLDPALAPGARGLDKPTRLRELAARLAAEHTGIRARIAGELVSDILERTTRIRALERELAARTRALVPQLLELPGCGPLSAAKIVGETARPGRSAPKPALPCTPASPRSPPAPGAPTVTDSLVAAIGSSTPRCTASRSPRSGCPAASARATTNAAPTPATPSPKPCAPSNAASPGSCSTSCSNPPTPLPAHTRQPLDIGAT